MDAGLFIPRAVIGNFVWADGNGNGIQDASEPGLGGVLITLLDGGGNPVATAITNADGGYLFPNVAPGNYSMVFTNLPTGVTFTIPNAGGNVNIDSDVTGSSIFGIVVTTTTVNLTYDAGVLNSAVLAAGVEFTANKRNNTAELNWKLSGALNDAKEFVIERSPNGINYSTIGTQLADNKTVYQQIDLQPIAGINYYRLKIISLAGEIKYSEVRVLVFNSKGSISIFPNPVTDVLNIQLPDSFTGKPVLLDLVNQAGQVVATKSAKQANQVERLYVNQLPAGVYILRIQDSAGGLETMKVKVN